MDRRVATDMLIDWDTVYALADTLFIRSDDTSVCNYNPTEARRATRQPGCSCHYHRKMYPTRCGRSFVADGAIDPRELCFSLLFTRATSRDIYRRHWEFMAREVAVLPVPQ